MKKLVANWVWKKTTQAATGFRDQFISDVQETAGDIWKGTTDYVKMGYEKVGTTLGIPLNDKIKKQIEYQEYLERKARGEAPAERKVTNEELEAYRKEISQRAGTGGKTKTTTFDEVADQFADTAEAWRAVNKPETPSFWENMANAPHSQMDF